MYGRQGRYLDLIFGSILTIAYFVKIISSELKKTQFLAALLGNECSVHTDGKNKKYDIRFLLLSKHRLGGH